MPKFVIFFECKSISHNSENGAAATSIPRLPTTASSSFLPLQNSQVLHVVNHNLVDSWNHIVTSVCVGHVVAKGFESPLLPISSHFCDDASRAYTVLVVTQVKSTELFL